MIKLKSMKPYIIAVLLSVLAFTACEKDNYAPPKSKLHGALLYKGDSVRVSYNNVTFQLWQSGFGKLTPINVTVAQNGSFSALLFDGDYKLIIQPGQGPFVTPANPKTNSDTILVTMKGDQTLDIEVLPYFMIRNPQFDLNDHTVNASCSIEKVLTDSLAKSIESISLYIGKTKFVDKRTSIATATIKGGDIADLNKITLSKKIPEMTPTQNFVFVRIGLKINSVEDMIFSPAVELDF